MEDNRDIVYSAIFFFFGVYSFFRGFKRLRRKRKIENIPTSTVRGLAMGLVELIGRAGKRGVLRSPITESECVFYRFKVERYESSGRSGRWVTVAKGDSSFSQFWIDDGTGRILVSPEGAEFIIPISYEFRTGIGISIPDNLILFLRKNNIRYRGFFCNYPLRFSEWRIYDKEKVYVLGTAAANQDNYLETHQAKIIRRLEEIKNSPLKMSELDLDKDGKISMEEWDSAVANVERELLEEELKNSSQQEHINVVIDKGAKGEVFVISNSSQKDLIKKLSWQSFCGIFGGAVLSIFTLGYLLFRLNQAGVSGFFR